MADALKAETRDYDLAGRFGGEEFTVLLPGAGITELANTAERIRRRIAGLVITVTAARGPATIDDLTCSIGAAVYPDSGSEVDQLLLAADTATYAAKNAGRNQVQLAPVDGPSPTAA